MCVLKIILILQQDVRAVKCFVGIKPGPPLEMYIHSLSKKHWPMGAVLPLTVTHLETFFANMPVVVIGSELRDQKLMDCTCTESVK